MTELEAALHLIDGMLAEVESELVDARGRGTGGRRLNGDFGAVLGLIVRRGVIREVRDRITGDEPNWPADPLKPGESRLSDLFPGLGR